MCDSEVGIFSSFANMQSISGKFNYWLPVGCTTWSMRTQAGAALNRPYNEVVLKPINGLVSIARAGEGISTTAGMTARHIIRVVTDAMQHPCVATTSFFGDFE